MKILMAAAENDALPRGKVGGIGDVVRDIPIALTNIGQEVDVVLPGYGIYSSLPQAEHITSLGVKFSGTIQSVDIFKVTLSGASRHISQWIIEHPLFSTCGKGVIYCDDPNNRPFASDATKFALFSVSVAQAIVSGVFGDVDVLHLHDWHTATISALRAYDPDYKKLQDIKTVYTIHNLALQGIRPFADDESSLKAWFPDLAIDEGQINDPRYLNCYNPMRAAINLADKIHAVSPTYAKEILLPSNPEQGYFGGEGLEKDLTNAAKAGKLHGILNGCEYENIDDSPQLDLKFNDLLNHCEASILNWISNKPLTELAHLTALTRLKQMSVKQKEKNDKYIKDPIILTSVGRITAQKIQLFKQLMPDGKTALEHLLDILSDDGVFILLGSGDKQLENYLTEIASIKKNFIFLKGYSEVLSESIYNIGNLFLMPSSFEPCGISQMLSMRAGQPCLAHQVGGLTDTIIDQKNGFLFSGDTSFQQAINMLSCFSNTLALKKNKPKQWQKVCDNALRSRFLWRDVAKNYIKYLYS